VIDAQPSRTAARVAIRRAVHQLIDRPLVFEDPLAVRVLDAKTRAALDANPRAFERGPWTAGLRAFLVVRSRIAEDALAAAVARGVRQYVVLGAGLDTFAHRNPYPELRVFEVDHPQTQRWKRERMEGAGLQAPATLTYVAVDFERQTLADEIERAGLKRGEPTFVSWLGVVPYLQSSAVWDTLAWAASVAGDGGGIAFDYAPPLKPWNLLYNWRFRRFAARVAALGEPFRTFLRPEELRQRLSALGLSTIADMGAAELNRKYFAGRADGLRLGGHGRMLVACSNRTVRLLDR
jgi:methyltransferase (TIGR00027 family)